MENRFHTAVQIASSGLTAAVATCSGVLIGLFAYAGQRDDLSACAKRLLTAALVSVAVALMAALASFLLAYLSELKFIHDETEAHERRWKAAATAFGVSYVGLGLAFVFGGLMIWS